MRLTPVFLLSATDVAHFPTEAKTFGAPESAFDGGGLLVDLAEHGVGEGLICVRHFWGPF